MLEGLYDRDVLIWSEQQAALLRRLAAGELLNEAVDWENLIDEVEAVGRSELHACENHVRQALVHLLKLRTWQGNQAANHWRGETVGFLAGAQRSFTPSMRQRTDLEALYKLASKQVRIEAAGGSGLRPLPETCPFTLDELLAADAEVVDLETKLAAAA